MESVAAPRFTDIVEADARIRPLARITPLLSSPDLDSLAGARVLVKAECLQPRGSFKVRGAANAILKRADEARALGIVAFSSGNHAQGVAMVARHIGATATIVVPADAPRAKLAAAEADGAQLVTYDRATEDRMAIGARLVAETGAILVPPFDHPDVIAGQGTCGLEMVRQGLEMGIAPDEVIACCSGGGLASGIAVAVQTLVPSARVFTAEPEGFDDFARSLAGGAPVSNPASSGSIQDALLVPAPGTLTLPILLAARAEGLVASDHEALQAMAIAWRTLRIVLEPGGACALACLLRNRDRFAGRTVFLTASGGNADPDIFQRALSLA
jgi:threonine dehydratase